MLVIEDEHQATSCGPLDKADAVATFDDLKVTVKSILTRKEQV